MEHECENYDGACNGILTLRVNPFRAEIHEVEVEEMMCDCTYAMLKDEI